MLVVEFYADKYFFTTLKMLLHYLLIWVILMRNRLSSLSLFFCTYCHFLWTTYKILLSLGLSNLIMMHLGIVFFVFLVLEVGWASWVHGFIVFNKFACFSAIISNIVSVSPFPLQFCWKIIYIHHCISLISSTTVWFMYIVKWLPQ